MRPRALIVSPSTTVISIGLIASGLSAEVRLYAAWTTVGSALEKTKQAIAETTRTAATPALAALPYRERLARSLAVFPHMDAT